MKKKTKDKEACPARSYKIFEQEQLGDRRKSLLAAVIGSPSNRQSARTEELRHRRVWIRVKSTRNPTPASRLTSAASPEDQSARRATHGGGGEDLSRQSQLARTCALALPLEGSLGGREGSRWRTGRRGSCWRPPLSEASEWRPPPLSCALAAWEREYASADKPETMRLIYTVEIIAGRVLADDSGWRHVGRGVIGYLQPAKVPRVLLLRDISFPGRVDSSLLPLSLKDNTNLPLKVKFYVYTHPPRRRGYLCYF